MLKRPGGQKKRFGRSVVLTLAQAVVALHSGGNQIATANLRTITFDDLPPVTQAGSIPDGYGGFSWRTPMPANMGYIDVDDPLWAGSGYYYGAVTRPYVASSGDYSARISRNDPFDFIGAYFTFAWRPQGGYISAAGYIGSDLTPAYSKTVAVGYYSPTWCSFDFPGIDRLIISSWPYPNHFAMDNFTCNDTNVVPVPGAILLGILGLGVAGPKLRKDA